MQDPNPSGENWKLDDILNELGLLEETSPEADPVGDPQPEPTPEPESVAPPETVSSPLWEPSAWEAAQRAATATSPEEQTRIWNAVSPVAEIPAAPEPSAAPVEVSAPEPEEDPAEEPLTVKREIWEWVKAIALSFVVVFIIFGVLIKLVTVDGSSMEPTLQNNDRLVISNLFYTPEQGDIVVISKEAGLGKALIKRVIATGGQTLDITEDGLVTVNGLPLDEPYIREHISLSMRGEQSYPLTVPTGTVFVMGDNRNNSNDSRFLQLSFVDEEDIMGRVLLRLYPLNHFGRVQ